MSQQPQPVINYADPSIPRPSRWKRYVVWSVAITMLLVLFSALADSSSARGSITLNEFEGNLRSGGILRINIGKDRLTGQFAFPQQTSAGMATQFQVALPDGLSGNWDFVQWVLANRGGATVEARNEDSLLLTIIVPLMPWALIFLFIWFAFRHARRTGTGQPMRVVVVNPPEQASKPE